MEEILTKLIPTPPRKLQYIEMQDIPHPLLGGMRKAQPPKAALLVAFLLMQF